MVARCPRTKALGIATCTTGRAVGSAVPHAEENVGAIATQANTNIFHGKHGLKLLKMGFEPNSVLQSTLALDLHPEYRQIIMIDANGRTAAFTGEKNSDWKGHVEGENYVAGGNFIVGPEILPAMIKAFENMKTASLQDRLINALEAGEMAGGCNWPHHTAALLVVGINDEMKLFCRPNLDLRIDSSDNPIKDLKEAYEMYKKYIEKRRKDTYNITGFL